MKIAICGTAPSSAGKAPFGDPSWTVWGCSPGLMGAPRLDAWFEIHPLDEEKDKGYLEFLTKLECPVWLIEQQADIPASQKFPLDEMIQEFGPWFFTSTIAYMLAMAILEKPEEIGLWGVDMSATEEYGYQRAGCHYFIHEARKRGIKVTTPPESDLLYPAPLYGYVQAMPMWRKLEARRQELAGRKADAENRKLNAESEVVFLSGCLSNQEYMMNTYLAERQGEPNG